MAAYLWLLAVPVLLALARRAGPRQEARALLLAWFALTLFIGLRREVGADWDNYLLMHARAGAHALSEAIFLGDPAYMLVSGALFRLGFAVPAVNLVCAAIFSAGLFLLARTQPSPGLAFIVALPVLVAIAAFTPRQSAAIGLLTAALALAGSGRPRVAALLIAAAPAFHWTAILLVPLIPAMLTRNLPPRLMMAAGAAAGLALAALLALTPLGDRFDHVGESAGALLRGGLTLLTLAVLAATWRRLDLGDGERRAIAGVAAIGLFALALTPILSTAGDRLGYYAVPLQMIVLPRAAFLLHSPALRLAALTATALLHAALFLGWMSLSPYRVCQIPYRSYLADPAEIRVLDPDVHRRSRPCAPRARSSAGQSGSTAYEETLG